MTGELIETLWNVNSAKSGNNKESEEELIETLWNVNSTIINAYFDDSSN